MSFTKGITKTASRPCTSAALSSQHCSHSTGLCQRVHSRGTPLTSGVSALHVYACRTCTSSWSRGSHTSMAHRYMQGACTCITSGLTPDWQAPAFEVLCCQG
jgi:hypothetical protein